MKLPTVGCDLNQALKRPFAIKRFERDFRIFRHYLEPRKDSKVLELGSSEGFFLAALNLNGYEAYGVDIDRERVVRAKRVLEENSIPSNRIKEGQAENIPFKDDFFDYVISYQTLEHVSDVSETFREIERVLKEGGETLATCPNYNSFYETHYSIFMIPSMSKSAFKKYLKLVKHLFPRVQFRSPIDFVDNLNFVTPALIDSSSDYLKTLKLKEVGGEIFMEKFRSTGSFFEKPPKLEDPSMSKIFLWNLSRILKILRLNASTAKFIVKHRLHPVLVIVGRKDREVLNKRKAE